MRLFQRIGDIIAANLNDLVDRYEDPEVMLKQAIREMDTMIESVTAGAARAIAGERLLSKDLSDHEQKTVQWCARAEEGVSRGDDDLARQAIARAHEHEAMAQALLESERRRSKRRRPCAGRLPRSRPKRPRPAESSPALQPAGRPPGSAAFSIRQSVRIRAEPTGSHASRGCITRSSKLRPKPKPLLSSTRAPTSASRRRSSCASKLAASRLSLPPSSSGSGQKSRPAFRLCLGRISPRCAHLGVAGRSRLLQRGRRWAGFYVGGGSVPRSLWLRLLRAGQE